MLWPGCYRLTHEITRFVATEGRLFVISASGLIWAEDLPADTPQREKMLGVDGEKVFYDGGSCIAGPDGQWLIEPSVGKEQLLIANLDYQQVLRERQNMDPSRHYSRPDVFQLRVNRERQRLVQEWQPNGHPGSN